jgi:hypothetical protein
MWSEVIYDIATSSSTCEDRELSPFAHIGSDGVSYITEYSQRTIDAMKAWESVTKQSDL